MLDHIAGQKSPDWITTIAEVRKARFAEARKVLDAAGQSAATATASVPAAPVAKAGGPSLELSRYAGKYRDPWYGLVTIDSTAKGLAVRFEHTADFSSTLEHVRNDTFRTRWADRTLEDAYVTFALNPDGSIERMTMRAISPLADFSFDFQDLLFKPES